MSIIHLILSKYMLEKEDYDESYSNSWQSVCKELNIDYTIIYSSPYEEPEKFIAELPTCCKINEGKIPVFFGTIEMCRKVKEYMKDKSIDYRLFYDEKEFECTNYYPKMSCFIPLVNREYIVMEYWQVLLSWDQIFDYFHSSILFFRPNDSTKSFTGANFMKGNEGKELFKEHTDKNNTGWGKQINDNCLVVIAPSKKIISEYRFFIYNKQVITGSQYNRNNTLDIRSDYLEKAKKIAELVAKQEYQPYIAYTCDIAEMNCEGGEMQVIELNEGSSSGFYEMNKKEILKALIN